MVKVSLDRTLNRPTLGPSPLDQVESWLIIASYAVNVNQSWYFKGSIPYLVSMIIIRRVSSCMMTNHQQAAGVGRCDYHLWW